ncbi:MAG: VCBS repeat-containing protein [Planctomycetaceae bacterium]|nr:VCBS repeat-containing protein [Planctomycetales bacterium]MCB9927347.1 VCBS repeat-containing protein [Planctomycetaceae bacterium]
MLTSVRRCVCFLYSAILFFSAIARTTGAEPPRFRTHTVSATSEFAACAAIDVNDDGKLDIVSGGFWYEAPNWKQHFLRDVEVIRGRFDDYSHLPMDVNGDGRVDYVSANYRSQSIYWVENAGADAIPWKKHVVAEPGPMETAIMVDVDGDGRNDVLPNGTKFAAWWEVIPPTEAKGNPVWLRHDLPMEVAGHGVGFGDVNGDGRGDIVAAHGWLEAPADRRTGRWLFHREFSLDSDCSVPMLVVDVDRDGDNDLVWGRGHKFGVYWLEQRQANGERQWLRHTIDSEWSQAHSVYWADMNGDGQEDLVTGKRYLGHDGRDPGAFDPLVFYWYEFSTETRSWTRHPISVGERVGTGLDLKIVDMDKDGDLDVIASDKSGVYLCENLSVASTLPADAAGRSTSAASGIAANHQELLTYVDSSGVVQPIDTLADLCVRRQQSLHGMQAAMGSLPDTSRRVPLDVEVLEELDSEKYTRRRINFVAEPGDRVPAYVLIPKRLTAKAAAMLCLHQTTGIGKGEPAGLGGKATLHYAHELAERGFVCIVPDYPSFGDYAYDFKLQGKPYASGSMKAIWNNLRAVDLLVSLPEVDSDRIGCIGHSLGGHNALFTAAFDQRLKAVVTSCGFTAFHHYYEGKLAGWTSDRYMPRIRDVYENDPNKVPFDFHEVLAAICPRSIFINAPLHDSNFAVEGVQDVVSKVGRVYEVEGVGGDLKVEYPDSGHDFPDEIRDEAYRWLVKQLK